jgi:thiol-disulfide isomerase/thioredoxin
MNRRHLVLAGSVGALAAAAGVVAALYRSRPGAGGDADAAAALWKMGFPRPEGGTLAMAEVRGGPLLLNFWATWCAPCIKEMPMLDAFHRARGAAGWRVVGLAVDGVAPVRDYLGRLPMGFPIGLAGLEGVQLSRSLGNLNGGLPFTVVFRADGRIAGRKLGALSADDLDGWVRTLTPSA